MCTLIVRVALVLCGGTGFLSTPLHSFNMVQWPLGNFCTHWMKISTCPKTLWNSTISNAVLTVQKVISFFFIVQTWYYNKLLLLVLNDLSTFSTKYLETDFFYFSVFHLLKVAVSAVSLQFCIVLDYIDLFSQIHVFL